MNDLVEVPLLHTLMLPEMLDVYMPQTILKVEEEAPAEPAGPSLLLNGKPPLFCEDTAFLHCDPMRFVQMVHHYVPSLT